MKLQVLFLETGQEERPHSGVFREHGLLCLGCDSVFKRDLNCIPGLLSASQSALQLCTSGGFFSIFC